MIKNNSFFSTFVFFSVLGIILLGLHLIALEIAPQLNVENILHSHAFLFFLTITVVLTLFIVAKKTNPRIVTYVFLSSVLFKMIISVIYLFPVLRGDSPDQVSYIIQFFIIYFYYLFAEVYYLAKQNKT